MADPQRARKMADRIKEVVARGIDKGLRDPRLGFVTITDVRVTGDLQHASVFYTVYGTDEERADSAAALKAATGMLRTEVGKNITARLTPSLEFIADALPETSAHLEDLLVQAQVRDEQVAQLPRSARRTPATPTRTSATRTTTPTTDCRRLTAPPSRVPSSRAAGSRSRRRPTARPSRRSDASARSRWSASGQTSRDLGRRDRHVARAEFGHDQAAHLAVAAGELRLLRRTRARRAPGSRRHATRTGPRSGTRRTRGSGTTQTSAPSSITAALVAAASSRSSGSTRLHQRQVLLRVRRARARPRRAAPGRAPGAR